MLKRHFSRGTRRAASDRMRLRERCLLHGADSLDATSLVALLLGTGTAGRSTEAIARELLDAVGGLDGLLRAEPALLASVRGVGPARALRIHAALSLGLLACRRVPDDTDPIDTARAAAAWLGPGLAGRPVEEVHALYLDRRLRPVRLRRLSVGTRDASMLSAREIVRGALVVDADAVVLAHNHPSGDPEPSSEDISATRSVRAALDTIGTRLVDHLVFGAPERWVSMAARGVLR
jgi:DNA repair protein RadC